MKHVLLAASISAAALVAGAANAMNDVVIAFAGTEDLENDAEYVFIKGFVDSMAQHDVGAVVHPSNTMGKESDRFDQVSQGLIDVNLTNVGVLMKTSKYASVLFLPFLSSDQDEFDTLIGNAGALEKINEEAANLGVKVVGFPMRGGSLGLFNTEKPISKMSDMNDMRFRAQNGDQLEYFAAWGAKPTIVSWAETPNALQTGVAVGHLNPPSTVVAAGQVELLKHHTPLDAGPVPKVVMISTDWYNSLSDEEKGWVDQAIADGIAANRKWASEKEEYFLKTIQDGGITVTELEPGEREKFIEATKTVWEKLVPEETLKEILDAKAKGSGS